VVDNCKKINVDGGHYCYFEAPKSSSKECVSLSNYEYDNIKTLVKYYKTFGGNQGGTED
jgi:hypothetical protein